MLGYSTNKKLYYKGDTVEYNLQKAIAFSGGTQQHLSIFKELLVNSIINQETNRPVADYRAAELLLFKFPFKVRVVLSLFFYQQEVKNASKFEVFESNKNILYPSQQIILSSLITREKINNGLLTLIDENKDTSISSNDIKKLFDFYTIKTPYELFTGNISSDLNIIFNSFNISSSIYNEYMEIVNSNDRILTAAIIARQLNYKAQSITYLTQAVTAWQSQTLNI